MGGPSPGLLVVHWTQPNPAPAQGPSRPPRSSHTGLLQSALGQAIPSSLRPSRCPNSGTAPSSFGHLPPPLPCELYKDRDVSLVVIQDP